MSKPAPTSLVSKSQAGEEVSEELLDIIGTVTRISCSSGIAEKRAIDYRIFTLVASEG
jgi:hypothetical protein